MLPTLLIRKSNPDNWATSVHAWRLPGVKRANMELPYPNCPFRGGLFRFPHRRMAARRVGGWAIFLVGRAPSHSPDRTANGCGRAGSWGGGKENPLWWAPARKRRTAPNYGDSILSAAIDSSGVSIEFKTRSDF